MVQDELRNAAYDKAINRVGANASLQLHDVQIGVHHKQADCCKMFLGVPTELHSVLCKMLMEADCVAVTPCY